MVRSFHRWIKHAAGNLSILFCDQCLRSISVLLIHRSRNISKMWEHALQHHRLEWHHRVDYVSERTRTALIVFAFYSDIHFMDRPSTFLVYVITGSPARWGVKRLTSITGGQDKKQPCALIVANKEKGGGNCSLSGCHVGVRLYLPPRRGSLAQPVYKGKATPRG